MYEASGFPVFRIVSKNGPADHLRPRIRFCHVFPIGFLRALVGLWVRPMACARPMDANKATGGRGRGMFANGPIAQGEAMQCATLCFSVPIPRSLKFPASLEIEKFEISISCF